MQRVEPDSLSTRPTSRFLISARENAIHAAVPPLILPGLVWLGCRIRRKFFPAIDSNGIHTLSGSPFPFQRGTGPTARSMALSACAEMVKVGFAARAPGMVEPSTMKKPGWTAIGSVVFLLPS